MITTDFHTHILPGIDDGSAGIEESLAMLRMEWEQGIRRVVATPHFYPTYDTPEAFLHKRDMAEAQLRKAMDGCERLPLLEVGAEVYYFRGISESEYLPRLTIRDKQCILIEMPQSPWPESALAELAAIRQNRGVIPVIAHIDRYLTPFWPGRILRRLAELPVLVQANASFFRERRTAALALNMLKADQIHFLGSDCHNMSDRLPDLDAAIQSIRKRLGDDALQGIRAYEKQILGE